MLPPDLTPKHLAEIHGELESISITLKALFKDVAFRTPLFDTTVEAVSAAGHYIQETQIQEAQDCISSVSVMLKERDSTSKPVVGETNITSEK